MLPLHVSPPSLATWTTILPPRPLLALARMMTLHCHLLPLPVPMRLPRPYQPHFMSSTASPMCHCPTTSTPFLRHPSKARTFPLPHRIQPPLLYQCPTPPPKRGHLPLPFPLPPYLPPFPSSTTQTSGRLSMHQISHLQLLLIQIPSLDNSYYCTQRLSRTDLCARSGR
ncbi:hypothetical protein EDB84DRAFT_1511032 [Lactarius hengduanensis]|nr:hypothetical protein EDB84DRAFT_1511032 [Lactarius hengduanensis]